MAAALVPLAALAFGFSYSDHLRRAEAEQSRFVDYARLIGQSSAKLMARTEGYAAASARRLDSNFNECDQLFGQMRKFLRPAIDVRVFDGDRLLCRDGIGGDEPELPDHPALAVDTPPIIPVRGRDDESGITVEIGLRPRALLTAPIEATVSSHLSFALVDQSGRLLAVHADNPDERADFLNLMADGSLTTLPLRQRYRTDQGWLLATVPLPGSDFRIVTGVPPSGTTLEPWVSVAKALLLPISLLAVVFVVLRFGTQRFLLRYIRHIYATFRRYGSGDTEARVGKLDNAPAEIKVLGLTFDMMADRIAYRTQDLEESLAEQQRLTRELHHRIKNTLQMISSLLGMQRREVKLDAEKAALRVALERVLGISAAYRVSYASNEGTDVALEALVREVVDALREPAMLRRSLVEVVASESAHATIVLDKAIPLAFILAELLPPRFSCLLPGESIRVQVSCEESIVLEISGATEIENYMAENEADNQLAARLMRAYLGQLSATLTTEGAITRLEMSKADAIA